MLQHGAYTLITDACYDREKFPTLRDAIDWSWASNQEEKDAVEFVLNKFFKLKDGVFIQKRIQEELDNYHKNSKTNKRIAIERETKRRENSTDREEKSTNRAPTVNEPPPNYKLRTKNQELVTKNYNNKTKTSRFAPPSVEQVKEYCSERSNQVDPESFVDFYTGNGWKRGKTAIKDWKACVRTWEKNGNNSYGKQSTGYKAVHPHQQGFLDSLKTNTLDGEVIDEQ